MVVQHFSSGEQTGTKWQEYLSLLILCISPAVNTSLVVNVCFYPLSLVLILLGDLFRGCILHWLVKIRAFQSELWRFSRLAFALLCFLYQKFQQRQSSCQTNGIKMNAPPLFICSGTFGYKVVSAWIVCVQSLTNTSDSLCKEKHPLLHLYFKTVSIKVVYLTFFFNWGWGVGISC